MFRDRHVLRRLLGLLGLDGSLLLLANDGTECDNFVQNHLSHLADVFNHLEVEVKGSRARGLVRGIVPDVQVAMLQGFFDGDTLGRIKRQHAVEKVQSVEVGAGEETLEGDLWHEWQVANVFLCPR